MMQTTIERVQRRKFGKIGWALGVLVVLFLVWGIYQWLAANSLTSYEEEALEYFRTVYIQQDVKKAQAYLDPKAQIFKDTIQVEVESAREGPTPSKPVWITESKETLENPKEKVVFVNSPELKKTLLVVLVQRKEGEWKLKYGASRMGNQWSKEGLDQQMPELKWKESSLD